MATDDKPDLRRLLIQIEPQWRTEFEHFVETGEATDAFLAYLDQNETAQKIIESAFKGQAARFEVLAEALKPKPALAAQKSPNLDVSFSPTTRYVENGYEFNETSLEWKEACRNLPCFSAIRWPDYSTEVIEETINGEPVVIQLWIGWCQKFLGRGDFPGGIGAEVGIYHRIPGHPPPSTIPFMPKKGGLLSGPRC